jgi:hypothetical protein
MQLIITQSAFVWIFGIVGVLFAIILLLVIVGLAYGVALLRLINEKSKDVAETVDVVRNSVQKTADTFDSTREHVAQFVSSAVNAGNIANVVRIVRNAWHGHEEAKDKTDSKNSVEDVLNDITINNKKAREGELWIRKILQRELAPGRVLAQWPVFYWHHNRARKHAKI